MTIEIKNHWTGAVIYTHSVEGATMRDAVLAAVAADSNLRGSDLSGSDLSDANLSPIRNDIIAILCSAPREVPALIAALAGGRVDGSTYSGECSCLVGTIATARGVDAMSLTNGLKPDSSRPAECFFMGIKKGDTPEMNQVSALAHQWASE